MAHRIARTGIRLLGMDDNLMGADDSRAVLRSELTSRL